MIAKEEDALYGNLVKLEQSMIEGIYRAWKALELKASHVGGYIGRCVWTILPLGKNQKWKNSPWLFGEFIA